MIRHSPAALLLLAASTMLALAAAAARVPIDPVPAARMLLAAPTYATGFGLLFEDARLSRMQLIKLRCEESFLDYVELMWPALDSGQPFVRGDVQTAIALHLEAVTHGKIKNLLGNVPPGSTKTYLANVFWPSWEWGPRNLPDLRYMSWSYSRELADKANDDCRKIIKHEVYQRFWGDRFKLLDTSDAKSFYENDKGGWRRSSSVKGAGTGFRADRLIWDDPISVKDADSPAALKAATRWFARTLPTRVRNATGTVDVRVPFWVRDIHGLLEVDPERPREVKASATVGIMQRLHAHDISGIILKNPALGYEVLLIEMKFEGDEHPARKLATWPKSTIGYRDWRTELGQLADPVRFPQAEIDRLEAQMISEGAGADAVSAQFRQWPEGGAGSLFAEDKLVVIPRSEAPSGVDRRGWDFAGSDKKKSDESATVNLRRGSNRRWYLMQSEAGKTPPAKFDKMIRKYHNDDPITLAWSIPQDPGQAGKHQVSYIVRELTAGRVVHSSRELGKIVSAGPVASQVEHDNFFIVEHPGWQKMKSQLVDFPYGQHDDLVDALSRAFAEHIAHPAITDHHGGFSGGGEEEVQISETTGSARDFDF